MATRLRGYVATPPRSYSVRGYAATWLRGHVATWLRGYRATWLRGHGATATCLTWLSGLPEFKNEGYKCVTP